ncbi:DUF2309 domain-containing protein [Bryobacter aggregatus]|uniref:DUF2309 domain-containing protein n=1 Tax=Bryobacter aggregatus TaxID=360054 RepID=UPI000B22336F|nr:DUF2309 domain-containing protein [Bryobacter aggregatus]
MEASNHLQHILEHAAHLLPAQGPIGVFIHHNTLHAFQNKAFEDAVVEAGAIFGAEAYLREDAFQAECKRGRILAEDIRHVLANEPDASVLVSGLTRSVLRERILLAAIRPVDPETVDWRLTESPEFARLHHDASEKRLFEWAEALLEDAPERSAGRKPRLLNADEAIHPLLIRLASVYLDQGVAYWPMPGREHGFWAAVSHLLGTGGAIEPLALAGVGALLRKFPADSMQAIDLALDRLGIPERDRQRYIEDEFLTMPGWAGLFHCLEKDPGLAPHIVLPCKLADYLAVRLVLVCAAKENGAVAEVVRIDSNPARARALNAYLSLGALGIDAAKALQFSESERVALRDELAAFDDLERRRIYQLAYEWRHLESVLRPLVKRRQKGLVELGERASAQVFFCIDEREESIRRHLEEVDPSVETLGAAGFFGVAMHYQGVDDAHAVDLCPVIVKAAHRVQERAQEGQEAVLAERRSQRRKLAAFLHHSVIASRTLVRGWFSTAVLGLFSIFPLIGKVMTPLGFAKVTTKLNEWFLPELRTELAFVRDDKESHDAAHGLLQGFSLSEKADRVAGTLFNAGLVGNFSRIVVVLGHGSTSLNNPHESAHDCGACGGRRGGPNGRIFAAMANHPQVRAVLVGRGIVIPEDTWFVGGYHDTCHDGITLYDLDAVPASHVEDLKRITKNLDEARARSAQERARRFEAADPHGSPSDGLLHVEERAEHLAEPRPEYGHCTNAITIVGRRALTRGMFFDRRAFLTSYDATIDTDNAALARVMGAVIPVCGGISLEYYFSLVDNERYGCGTKLPHNISGLVGVMNGATSDLRTGLPWQMVEIHEPVRILFIVETTPERLMGVIHKSAELTEFVENRWIRLSTIDPETGEANYYDRGRFHPVAPADWEIPVAKSSADWYLGKMEHLPVALIEN